MDNSRESIPEGHQWKQAQFFLQKVGLFLLPLWEERKKKLVQHDYSILCLKYVSVMLMK